MCGRGRCARILRSTGIFGHGSSPAPGCITPCWVTFIERSRAVKGDPAWQGPHGGLPHRTPAYGVKCSAAFAMVEQAHGFSIDAAQSFASGLRRSWVREHLPAQETQNLGVRAFDAVKQWHVGRKGRPRFKPDRRRGLHSLSAKDGNGALRPKTRWPAAG